MFPNQRELKYVCDDTDMDLDSESCDDDSKSGHVDAKSCQLEVATPVSVSTEPRNDEYKSLDDNNIGMHRYE